MSAAAVYADDRPCGGNCTGYLVLLAVSAIIVALAVGALGVQLHGHAEVRHWEADDIRSCLDQNGPYMVFKHKFSPTWYLICEFDEGLWGLQAVTKDGHERTAFSPGDGSWRALRDYLDRIATRFTGRVPWLR